MQKNKGYTLIEMLFYISIFFLFTSAFVNVLITMTRSFQQTSIQADLLQGSVIMERISREVRQAESINEISTSDVILNTTDELGASKTVRFLLSGTDIQLHENGTLIGNLNTGNLQVTAVSFTYIATPVSDAIKIQVSVRSGRDATGRIEDFYDTVVLRQSY